MPSEVNLPHVPSPNPLPQGEGARTSPPAFGIRGEGSGRFRRIAALATFLLLAAVPAWATDYYAYVSNERDNTISVVDLDKGKTIATVPVGQRPRGILITKDGKDILLCASDDDTIQIIDRKTLKVVGELPSGPDPETFALHVSGNPLYISNENNALITVIDLPTRKVITQIPTGVEPEGMAVSPDGQTIVNTSETTNMAHFIDFKTEKMVASVLVPPRPRVAMFRHDGKEVWVSSELGGVVSVIDPVKHVITHTIHFPIQGLRSDYVQAVGIRFSPDDKLAFVALGPANRVAVVDTENYKVKKYLLVGQRVWQMAFTPDGKYLITTNGLSNDISVIDVAGLDVVRSIQVGRLPWGVAVAAPPQ